MAPIIGKLRTSGFWAGHSEENPRISPRLMDIEITTILFNHLLL
jgi:hypothetical protein